MVEGGHRLRLDLEAPQAVGVRGHGRGEHLERDLAPEAVIAGAVDLPHAARAEETRDFVGADAGPRGQLHVRLQGSRDSSADREAPSRCAADGGLGRAFSAGAAERHHDLADADLVAVGEGSGSLDELAPQERAVLAREVLEHRALARRPRSGRGGVRPSWRGC